MTNFSHALERVRAYRSGFWPFKRKPNFSGFYLSNEQLIQLGERLKTYGDGNHPDGVCFMVGKENSKYSVEMIPYQRDRKDGHKKNFYEDGFWVGFLMTTLSPEYPGAEPFFFSSNNAAPGGGIPQRTPPPSE